MNESKSSRMERANKSTAGRGSGETDTKMAPFSKRNSWSSRRIRRETGRGAVREKGEGEAADRGREEKTTKTEEEEETCKGKDGGGDDD